MGKVSLSNKIVEEPLPVKKKIMLPVLTKREWITFVSYSICLPTIGIFIGYLLFKRYNTHSADEIYAGKVDINGFGVMTGTGTTFTNHATGNVIGVVNPGTAYGINF